MSRNRAAIRTPQSAVAATALLKVAAPRAPFVYTRFLTERRVGQVVIQYQKKIFFQKFYLYFYFFAEKI